MKGLKRKSSFSFCVAVDFCTDRDIYLTDRFHWKNLKENICEIALVCGVVRPVSKLAKYAYAQVWIPLSSTNAFTDTWGDDNIMGMTAVYILAKSKDDFQAISQEADRLRAIFMAGHPNYDLLYRGQPDTYFVAAQRYSANNPPAVKEAVRQYILTLLVLLIVPAVNLSGLTLSRMRKRISEIGVRKAFGAPRRELMMQVLSENMLYSLFGGILGLILSYVAAFLLGGMLFSVDFVYGIHNIGAGYFPCRNSRT